MRFCRIAAAYVMCLAAWAASGYTVDQIKQFIQSAIKLKNPDKEVAETLRKMKLSERMDLDIVETLQSQGAGPKTVAVLKDAGNRIGHSARGAAAGAEARLCSSAAALL